MRTSRTYELRKEILKYTKSRMGLPIEHDDVINYCPAFAVYRPTREEAMEEINGLLANGYLRTIEGSNGLFTITAKGLFQINQEGDLDPYIWGKAGLKVLCMCFAVLVLGLCSGCRTNNIEKREYYESGQLKSECLDKSEGVLEWSEGPGKTIDVFDLNVSGVGLGK